MSFFYGIKYTSLGFFVIKPLYKIPCRKPKFQGTINEDRNSNYKKGHLKVLISTWYNRLLLMNLKDTNGFTFREKQEMDLTDITLEQWENIWRKSKILSICVTIKENDNIFYQVCHSFELRRIY